MLNKSLIGSITIPNYIRKVNLSEKQREKHYEWDGTTIKCKSKKLLQKYINLIYKNDIIKNDGNILPMFLKSQYLIIGFKGIKPVCTLYHDGTERPLVNSLTEKQSKIPTKYILCEELEDSYEKVIANQTQAGKPKTHIINGQAFYNQTLNPFARVKVMEIIKQMYYTKMWNAGKIKCRKFRQELAKSYPLIIEMEIYDTIKSEYDTTKKGDGRRWDVGNRAEPYMKGFLDFLTIGYWTYKDGKQDFCLMEPFIEDDDRTRVISGNNAYFFPIEEGGERKLIFNFYKLK